MCALHDALQAGKQKDVHPPYLPDLALAGARSGDYGGFLSVSLPDEHHERQSEYEWQTTKIYGQL
jgi:hypothetical protein